MKTYQKNGKKFLVIEANEVYASYLINNDDSAAFADIELDAWLTKHNLHGKCIDCSEDTRYGCCPITGFLANLSTYTFIR